MDVSMMSEVLFANQYFKQAISKIYVRRDRDNTVWSLAERHVNQDGGKCYYLSTWALLGLNETDRLVRGTIRLPDLDRNKGQDNYQHGWVRFSYRKQEWIYDPLYPYVFPAAAWEAVHAPKDITFDKSQVEILEVLLQEKYAHQLTQGLWQLKARGYLPLEWDKRSSGFLSDTMAEAQIKYRGTSCYFALVVSYE